MDSSAKCNVVDFILPVILEVEGTFWQEEFSGSFPSEGFSDSGVEHHGDVERSVIGSAVIERNRSTCRRNQSGDDA